MDNDKRISYIRGQQDQLFGMFPQKTDYESKYIMVCLEIFRIHHRAQDFRNAYTVLTRLNERCPNSMVVINRLGTFCLEIGRKVQAISLF